MERGNMFPTREQLMSKPLNVVRALDVRTKEEENLLQEVVNIKLGQRGVDPESLNRNRILRDEKGRPVEIKTKEQEDHYQKLIDAEMERLKPKPIEVVLSEPELEQKIAEIETKQEEITSFVTSDAVAPIILTEELKAKLTSDAPILIKKFCEFCDSKGVKHKLNCTRPQ